MFSMKTCVFFCDIRVYLDTRFIIIFYFCHSILFIPAPMDNVNMMLVSNSKICIVIIYSISKIYIY